MTAYDSQTAWFPVLAVAMLQTISSKVSTSARLVIVDRLSRIHILAISQASCHYRRHNGISGPLFIGFDTHVLSEAALRTALEVFAANDVNAMIDEHDGYTRTPGRSASPARRAPEPHSSGGMDPSGGQTKTE